ncbi:MAG: hypothetical protein IIB55_00720 [Planctomycetes bacterium]|nr:hypothetical protein [Planctomycetota bacterium]
MNDAGIHAPESDADFFLNDGKRHRTAVVGVPDIFDFLCVQNALAGGCP